MAVLVQQVQIGVNLGLPPLDADRLHSAVLANNARHVAKLLCRL